MTLLNLLLSAAIVATAAFLLLAYQYLKLRRKVSGSNDDTHLMAKALNHALHAVVMIDIRQQGKPIVYVNQSFTDMTYYSESAITGTHFTCVQ